MIRFNFNPSKGLDGIVYLLQGAQENNRASLDFHALLKAAYFADKAMLNQHGRPVFGATYRAMPYGPVPVELYEMAKCEPLWLAEIGAERYPWERSGQYSIRLSTDEVAELENLSEADREHLDLGLEKSLSLNFSRRTEATHGIDWANAFRGSGWIDYCDMIAPDNNRRTEIIEELEVTSSHLAL